MLQQCWSQEASSRGSKMCALCICASASPLPSLCIMLQVCKYQRSWGTYSTECDMEAAISMTHYSMNWFSLFCPNPLKMWAFHIIWYFLFFSFFISFFSNIYLLLMPQFSDVYTLLLIHRARKRTTIENFISGPFDAKLGVQNHNTNH